MREDLDKKLVEKYPKLFALKTSRGSGPQMPFTLFSFECGSGWYNIINMLCSNIQGHIDNKNRQREFSLGYNQMIEAVQRGDTELFNARYKDYRQGYKEEILANIQSGRINLKHDIEDEFPQVEVTQVKEKFGTLRFYTSHGDDYIYGAIAMAESMSAVTCETCGKPGKLYTYGWWHVACDEHKTQDDIEWENLKEKEDEHLENDAS